MILVFSLLMMSFFISLFPILASPVSLGGLLIMLSLSLVILISMISSAWYGYLLFLVYVGGLLVLFIYMCMISSNSEFSSELPQIMLVSLLISFSFSNELFNFNMVYLGNISFDSSLNISLSLFICLVIILIIIFLAVVEIVKINSSLQIEEK